MIIYYLNSFCRDPSDVCEKSLYRVLGSTGCRDGVEGFHSTNIFLSASEE